MSGMSSPALCPGRGRPPPRERLHRHLSPLHQDAPEIILMICEIASLEAYREPSELITTRGWATEIVNFLIGIARWRHHMQVRNSPWATFFCGVEPPKTHRPLPSSPS